MKNIPRADLESGKETEDQLETTLHEIFHILGFSSWVYQYWYDPITNSAYGTGANRIFENGLTYRGLTTSILTSPNLLKYAREYYNCADLEGVQLENCKNLIFFNFL